MFCVFSVAVAVYVFTRDTHQHIWRRLDPTNAEYVNNYGVSLMRMGRLEEAGDYFTRALDIDPNNSVFVCCCLFFDEKHEHTIMQNARRGSQDESGRPRQVPQAVAALGVCVCVCLCVCVHCVMQTRTAQKPAQTQTRTATRDASEDEDDDDDEGYDEDEVCCVSAFAHNRCCCWILLLAVDPFSVLCRLYSRASFLKHFCACV